MATEKPLVLVTGASGYIASFIVKNLLEDGYRVRGTVRSLENEDKVKPVKELVPDAKHPIELVEADLLKEETWTDAVKGCAFVIHVASPFPDSIPNDPNDLIKPAVDGTLAVLKAASESGTVKRVVLTSSIAAVYDASLPLPKKDNEETKKFTEEHWTDSEDPQLDAYSKSKTLAEKAAWDFIKGLPEDKKLELAVINPGMVLGPLLVKGNYATSHGVIKKLLDKSTPAICKMNVAFADVRDVARAHVQALVVPEAAGNRHLIVSKDLWLKDIAQIIKKEFQPKGYHVPTIVVPNVFVWLNSLVEKTYKIVVPRLGREFSYENKRMVDILKVEPTEFEKTLIDTAASLIDLEIVKKREKKAKRSKGEKPAEEQANGEAKQNGEQVNGTTEEVAANGKELEPEDKKPALVENTAVEVAAN